MLKSDSERIHGMCVIIRHHHGWDDLPRIIDDPQVLWRQSTIVYSTWSSKWLWDQLLHGRHLCITVTHHTVMFPEAGSRYLEWYAGELYRSKMNISQKKWYAQGSQVTLSETIRSQENLPWTHFSNCCGHWTLQELCWTWRGQEGDRALAMSTGDRPKHLRTLYC